MSTRHKSLIGLFLIFCTTFPKTTKTAEEEPELTPQKDEVIMGTTIFSKEDLDEDCWPTDRLDLLETRMILNDLVPGKSTLHMVDDDLVVAFLQYFELIFRVIEKTTYGKEKAMTLLATNDILGGYMFHMLIPAIKHSFYAGAVKYKNLKKILKVYNAIKKQLRTNGVGWATPSRPLQCRIVPNALSLRFKNNKCGCGALVMYYQLRKQKENVHHHCHTSMKHMSLTIPLPFLDCPKKPSAIAVPFKFNPLRGIFSTSGAAIVLEYFLRGYKCLVLRRANYSEIMTFNNALYSWILEDVKPRLDDTEIYPAFGSVLRVIETLKRMGAKKIDIYQERDRYKTLFEYDHKKEYSNDDIVPPKDSSSLSLTTSRRIVLAVLITIIIWFAIGSCFVCYRIRHSSKGSSRGGSTRSKSKTTTSATFSNISSLFDKAKKKKNDFSTSKSGTNSSKTSTKGKTPPQDQKGKKKTVKRLEIPSNYLQNMLFSGSNHDLQSERSGGFSNRCFQEDNFYTEPSLVSYITNKTQNGPLRTKPGNLVLPEFPGMTTVTTNLHEVKMLSPNIPQVHLKNNNLKKNTERRQNEDQPAILETEMIPKKVPQMEKPNGSTFPVLNSGDSRFLNPYAVNKSVYQGLLHPQLASCTSSASSVGENELKIPKPPTRKRNSTTDLMLDPRIKKELDLGYDFDTSSSDFTDSGCRPSPVLYKV